MKQIFLIILGVIAIVSLAVLGFTLYQVNDQRLSLSADLESRTKLLADSLNESVEPLFLKNSTEALQKVLDKFAGKQRLLGMVVYDNKGNVVASSTGLSESIVNDAVLAGQAMDANNDTGSFFATDSGKIYKFVQPLRQDNVVVGALMVVQRADYIDTAILQTWENNFYRFLVQALIISLAIVLILRFLIIKPVEAMVKSIKMALAGKSAQIEGTSKNGFFDPLTKEISKMSKSLIRARSAASEEARMRLEKLDTPWTAQRLQEFVKAYLKERTIFVVSNREPYSHKKVKNELICSIPASGVVTAMEPVMEACGGLWLAHGSGDADKLTVDVNDKIQVPPDEPKYTLKRVWLTEEEIRGYYVGFSNEALWPLCHRAHVRPIFRREDWFEYRKVNGKFAQNLLAEIKKTERPLILIQDFHFALLPQMIKKSRPDAQVSIFWHIPWPSAEDFDICPWKKEIVEGMLGADVIGFHTQQYCNNFMNTVAKGLEAVVDLEQFSVTRTGHISHIKPFPISVAFTNGSTNIDRPREKDPFEKFGIKTKYKGIGVDRLDYIKGILERFAGIEFFFKSHPDYKGQFTFLQIAPPSREGVEKYREFNKQVTDKANQINENLGTGSWKPIVLIKENLSHEELYPLYRGANVCLITSVHDGMNMVAKEYVAARNDESGVLILSQFAGASRNLKEAIIVNPYSAEQTAAAIYGALNMSPLEQHRRMSKMRESVKNYNVYRWSAELIKATASCD